jgi:hypothetical protein
MNTLTTLPIGAVVTAKLFGNSIVESTIVGCGVNKGRRVYDLADGHWAYESQIIKY